MEEGWWSRCALHASLWFIIRCHWKPSSRFAQQTNVERKFHGKNKLFTFLKWDLAFTRAVEYASRYLEPSITLMLLFMADFNENGNFALRLGVEGWVRKKDFKDATKFLNTGFEPEHLRIRILWKTHLVIWPRFYSESVWLILIHLKIPWLISTLNLAQNHRSAHPLS